MSVLLSRYNPTPVSPQDSARDRPGGFRPQQGRDIPERDDFVAGITSRFRSDSAHTSTSGGLVATRGSLSAANPEQSIMRESDVRDVVSQNPSQA